MKNQLLPEFTSLLQKLSLHCNWSKGPKMLHERAFPVKKLWSLFSDLNGVRVKGIHGWEEHLPIFRIENSFAETFDAQLLLVYITISQFIRGYYIILD